MDYRDLIFYQKSREVVKGINAEIKKWPNSMQTLAIANQVFRAALSVGANIAEGHGRHEGLEYIHFLQIAQGSANEIDHWLNTAIDCEIGTIPELRRLIALNNEVRRMLTSSITSLQNKYQNKSVRENPIPYSPIPYPPEDEL